MLEGDIAVHRLFLRVGRVPLDRCIEHLGDTRDGDACLAHFGNDPAEAAHRPDDHTVINGEGDEVALRHFAAHAQKASEDHDKHRLKTARHIADCPEIRHHAAELDPEAGVFLILLLEALALELLLPERAHHAHAGQIFLCNGGEHALRLVALREAVADGVVEQDGIGHDDREHDDWHQRQLPVHEQHTHQRQHDQHQNAENRHELLLKEGLDALHIGGTALDDIAGRIGHVPLPRKMLDVMIQQIAARFHERFAGLCAVKVHAVAEQRRDQAQRSHDRRRDPHMPPDILHAAEALDPPADRRDAHRLFPDERVHAHTDDLRDDQLTGRKDQSRQDAGRKISPASMQKPEENRAVAP